MYTLAILLCRLPDLLHDGRAAGGPRLGGGGSGGRGQTVHGHQQADARHHLLLQGAGAQPQRLRADVTRCQAPHPTRLVLLLLVSGLLDVLAITGLDNNDNNGSL